MFLNIKYPFLYYVSLLVIFILSILISNNEQVQNHIFTSSISSTNSDGNQERSSRSLSTNSEYIIPSYDILFSFAVFDLSHVRKPCFKLNLNIFNLELFLIFPFLTSIFTNFR